MLRMCVPKPETCGRRGPYTQTVELCKCNQVGMISKSVYLQLGQSADVRAACICQVALSKTEAKCSTKNVVQEDWCQVGISSNIIYMIWKTFLVELFVQ